MLTHLPLRKFVVSTFAIVATVLLLYRVTYATSGYQCPSGLSADDSVVVDSTCYAFYDAVATWSEAKVACENISGTLAVIRSETVQEAIFAMTAAPDTDAWLGGSDDGALIDDATEGNFFWIGDVAAFWTGGQGGDAVDDAYTNWATNEPNNANGGTEHCVEIYRTDGKWNDMTCTEEQKYVCEVAAVSVAEESGGGGSALWLIQLRQKNNLDARGMPLSSVSSSASSSSSQQSSDVHPAASTVELVVSSASSTSSSSSSSVSSSRPSSTPTQLQRRTCHRVRKWLAGNSSAQQRLNTRLLKHLGFTCTN